MAATDACISIDEVSDIQTESSSVMAAQLKYSEKEKGKGIQREGFSGASGFDEISAPKNSAAESSHMASINNLQITVDSAYNMEWMAVEEIISGSVKAHESLPCMDIYGCKESIPGSEVWRALPNRVIERYEERMCQGAIAEAKLEDLVYCPFCNIPYQVDKCVEILKCPNPKCLKASCIQCKQVSHMPLSCEEFEKMSEIDLRTKVEERMAKAVIRKCNNCQAELIKGGGCNLIKCRCGHKMCYVCRGSMLSGYSYFHFCGCLRSSAKPGKPCGKCKNTCPLWGNEVDDVVAMAAKEDALKKLVDKEAMLSHQDIGPPLQKLRAQPPSLQKLCRVMIGVVMTILVMMSLLLYFMRK